MNAMSRRIRKLEDRFGLVESEDVRRARERVATLRRRIAARARGEGQGSSGDKQTPDTGETTGEDLSGLTIAEVLRLRRSRAWARAT